MNQKALTIACLLASALVSSKELQFLPPSYTNPHRVHVKPNVFWTAEKANKEYGTIQRRQFFYGIVGEYEFLEENSLYFGLEGLLAVGRENRSFIDEEKFGRFSESNISCTAGNMEARFGSTLTLSNFSLISFIGLGEHFFSFSKSSAVQLVYLPLGIKSTFALGDLIQIGLNAKVLCSFLLYQQLDTRSYQTQAGFWGYEFALPILCKLQLTQQLETQFEPYYQKLIHSLNNHTFGGRVALGYAF